MGSTGSTILLVAVKSSLATSYASSSLAITISQHPHPSSIPNITYALSAELDNKAEHAERVVIGVSPGAEVWWQFPSIHSAPASSFRSDRRHSRIDLSFPSNGYPYH
ncbi:uncharacterized protein BDZ99DRAFT_187382 [Mytilinidion resinicola]|uniref:Uncharacterized protein n=1 Tax=Mytilinidion resinicola TaxID=574789 RepID=A0A6A6Z1Q7_9PEZI|nr:uncharacterized protein BDZ99DRAFT_187382 [Mytilinidion resinicola]KAF2814930.1 hypothetical protein BDZ99DRAFT_187382 [Mytilinidion resinicola]